MTAFRGFFNNINNDVAASYWPLFITGIAASMAVNTLMTGMIAFRILKGMGVISRPTSVERTLGSTGGNKYRHIMFIIIASAMALFAIQLVRIVLEFTPVSGLLFDEVYDIVIFINQMLNVIIIIRSIHFSFFFFLIIFTWLGNRTHNNIGAGSNEVVLRRRRILQGSCRKPSF